MSLTDLPKDKTPTKAYQKRFTEVVENKYKGWNHIYTDGSKSEIGVRAAATTGNRAWFDFFELVVLLIPLCVPFLMYGIIDICK